MTHLYVIKPDFKNRSSAVSDRIKCSWIIKKIYRYIKKNPKVLYLCWFMVVRESRCRVWICFTLNLQAPQLVCAKGAFRDFLNEHVPILKSKFWPTLWCFESRAQTVLANLLRSRIWPHIKYRRFESKLFVV